MDRRQRHHRPPKTITTDLTTGHDYRIAVWATTGTADFTVTVAPPSGTSDQGNP